MGNVVGLMRNSWI